MNELFLNKAYESKPDLFYRNIKPVDSVNFSEDKKAPFGVKVCKNADKKEIFSVGESVTLDFGEHWVGQISFNLSRADNYIDAPVKIRLRLGEIPMELFRDFKTYNGWLSASWLQEEIVTVDYEGSITLPRRYSARYVEITVLQAPQKVRLTDFCVTHVTSADKSFFEELKIADSDLMEIDRISVKTLEDCMQEVYEDGPKRDRRLWSGDFRLQALSDYYVFKNYKLIKRCLYFFAAGLTEGKYLPSCFYHTPKPYCKNGSGFMDYAFLYTAALCEYYEHTKDIETVKELFCISKNQIELAISGLDENSIVTIPDDSNGLID